ncbi:MAG TPA: tRNA (guanosine(46)-N7)-methyltransferase TrmB [Candidatus Cloacimonas sp.]|nr:tRNA (guanosine(46)-N7)-methyltransferase TrmB [Candidatus Cloacimonas sp.]
MLSDRDFFVLDTKRDSEGNLEPLSIEQLFPNPQPLLLEIGCGKGEFISGFSKLHPEINMLGLEAADKRINNTLKKLDPAVNPNVRLLRLYVDSSLSRLLPAESVEGVFIQHPDPWPKRKHHRRRLIQAEFLRALAQIMKPNAQVQISTDHAGYAAWIVEEFIASPAFIPVYEETLLQHSTFDNHITTWFEAEQRRLGFDPKFMLFKRI